MTEIEASDEAATVVVLEKMPEGQEGENARISRGSWFHNPDLEGQKVSLRSLSAEYPIPESVISVWSEETEKNTDGKCHPESSGSSESPLGMLTGRFVFVRAGPYFSRKAVSNPILKWCATP